MTSVAVIKDGWVDHAAVEVALEVPTDMMEATVWHRPKPLPWPNNPQCDVEWNPDLDPTCAYETMWRQVERQAGAQVTSAGGQWSPSQFGRGQTLAPKKVRLHNAPIRLGRHGAVSNLLLLLPQVAEGGKS